MHRILAIGPNIPSIGYLLTILCLAGCGSANSRLSIKQDYAQSLQSLRRSEYGQAAERLPIQEGTTFIPAMERTYLNLLDGNPDSVSLKPYRDMIDQRFRYVVSRELKSLFYMETPEGYYASEHEIIWMHLLLGWTYSELGEHAAACVEARMAGHLLDAPWSEEGHFDDPTLRVILAGLWARCGEWGEATVDFRAAWEMDSSLNWALQLSERQSPPANLITIWGGIGPEPIWDPKLEWNPLRGARALAFPPQGFRSTATIHASTGKIPLYLTPDTTNWYIRHVERDNAIHELIADSRYGLDTAYEAGRHSTMVAVGTTVVIVSTAVGLGATYLILQYCLQGGCPAEAYYLAILAPVMGVKYGAKKYAEITDNSKSRYQYETDPANFYRFVRFLPEYVWVGWTDENIGDESLEIRGADGKVLTRLQPPHGHAPGSPRVTLGHAPDAAIWDSREIPKNGSPGALPGFTR